jgi:hypothetical protein
MVVSIVVCVSELTTMFMMKTSLIRMLMAVSNNSSGD